MKKQKILLVPDSFKGTLNALKISNILTETAEQVSSDLIINSLPLSDGGDGFSHILSNYLPLNEINLESVDAFLRRINTYFLYNESSKTAFIESASAIGLNWLRREEYNPIQACSYGLGLLIKGAIDNGAKKIVIGLGGTATVDGGMGMLNALGVKFYNVKDIELAPKGGNLQFIRRIDVSNLDQRLQDIKIIAACDVENPLFGENGAAFVFAPQKGASRESIIRLDSGLQNFAQETFHITGIDLEFLSGGGAAGGIAAAMHAFFNAQLQSGFDILADLVGLKEVIEETDWIISAEGKTDDQTIKGKLIGKLAKIAKEANKPLLVFTANDKSNNAELFEHGVTSIFSIQNGPISFDRSIAFSEQLLRQTAENVFRLIHASAKN